MDSISQSQARMQGWAKIAALTADLEGMHVSDDTLEALLVDPEIYPRLPPITEVLGRLDDRLECKSTEDLRLTIRKKCLQLQDHVLNGYRSTVMCMPSMRLTLGLADDELQRRHSKGLEIWYRKAEQDILDVCIANRPKHPIVRGPEGQSSLF